MDLQYKTSGNTGSVNLGVKKSSRAAGSVSPFIGV